MSYSNLTKLLAAMTPGGSTRMMICMKVQQPFPGKVAASSRLLGENKRAQHAYAGATVLEGGGVSTEAAERPKGNWTISDVQRQRENGWLCSGVRWAARNDKEVRYPCMDT